MHLPIFSQARAESTKEPLAYSTVQATTTTTNYNYTTTLVAAAVVPVLVLVRTTDSIAMAMLLSTAKVRVPVQSRMGTLDWVRPTPELVRVRQYLELELLLR